MYRANSNTPAPAATSPARRDAHAARARGARLRRGRARCPPLDRRPRRAARAMSPVSPLERTNGARALEAATAHAIDDALARAAEDAKTATMDGDARVKVGSAPKGTHAVRVGSPGGSSFSTARPMDM